MKGYIRRTKSGRWEGQIELPRGPDGKRRRKSVLADYKLECQRKMHEYLRAAATQTKGD